MLALSTFACVKLRLRTF